MPRDREAAGVAAALSAASGVATSSLDVSELRAQLLKAGVILGASKESPHSDGGESDAG